jgi:hypothetical protein
MAGGDGFALGGPAGFDPAPENRNPLRGPGTVTGHRSGLETLEYRLVVRDHVTVVPKVEGKAHRATIVLTEQGLDVLGEADRPIAIRQRHWNSFPVSYAGAKR